MLDIEQPNQGPGNGVLMNLSGIGHWETGVDNAADFNFYFNNSLKGYILDTDGTYHNTSDMRIKKDIVPLDPLLSRVLKLNPTTYSYRNNRPGDARSLGFIAQEVETLFPELVSEKNDLKGLNYAGFGVISIKAIQEQQQIIEQQQRLIEELVGRVQKLEGNNP
jgi:hypothetical protein